VAVIASYNSTKVLTHFGATQKVKGSDWALRMCSLRANEFFPCDGCVWSAYRNIFNSIIQ